LAASAVTTASITVSAETLVAITLITMFGVAIAAGVFTGIWYWFMATQPLEKFKSFVRAPQHSRIYMSFVFGAFLVA
jgi:hypothetical protein